MNKIRLEAKMMNKKILLHIHRCKLLNLAQTLLANIAPIEEIFGPEMGETIFNIANSGIITKPDGHNLMLFNKEKLTLSISKGILYVNPRNVVWSLYLASQAIVEGKGSISKNKFKSDAWEKPDSLCQPKKMSLIAVGNLLYPVYDWTGADVCRDDKEIAIMWIMLGRPKVKTEDLDGSGFLTLA